MRAGESPLDTNWILALSSPGAWATPADAAIGAWLPAVVPGTAAEALERAGRWTRDAPAPLHDQDVWYRTEIDRQGPATLVFEGLATIAEVWLDDALLACSETMFLPLQVPVDLRGRHRLTLAFRGLAADLAGRKGPRARWRTRMVEDARLRFVRTTILGHAPGWCPPIHVVGPWRPVLIRPAAAMEILAFRGVLSGRHGLVEATIRLPDCGPDTAPRLTGGTHATPMHRDPDGLWRGRLSIPEPRLWWPRTHGTPHLYDVQVEIDGIEHPLGRTGFRSIAVDRGPDGAGFTLMVNDTRVFCRGACWTPDLVRPGGSRQDLEPVMRLLADAHVNMLRVGGTMVYEGDAFHALCDELGILVWQDCMLANFDYPRDDAFMAGLAAEVAGVLRRTAASPSLAVLCGGSEVLQQASMMGLPPDAAAHPFVDEALPALVAAERPDVVFVPGSPFGGALPFVADRGVSHYYGVGAYRRPLEDARSAGVRFAAECLAFANLPDDATLRRHDLDPSRDPQGWAARVPRDRGADWSFEDVRHHYMTRLHGIDPLALREADPQRYRDLSRATTAAVTEHTFDEWRRPGSPTAGGLVWFARDLGIGPGWGVIDADGRAKSNLHAMRRAFAPLRLSVTDEGVNGLALHGINDGADPVEGRLVLRCLRAGAVRVAEGGRDVVLPGRGGLTLTAFALMGQFFDAGAAYGFGDAPHDTVWVTLEHAGVVLAETHWLLPPGSGTLPPEPPVIAVGRDGTGWWLTLRATATLRAVVIDDDALMPDDAGFHLCPGHTRLVRLMAPPHAPEATPRGMVRALNLAAPVPYGLNT
ncbi:glycoside hydrolase family 2 protein [Lichenihabitans sp. Uapishka_5]|uniref:glycosyl hydrolase 2 galactose-binding domain-containing protein n=1 Tax=Lichenihabitans sp. Uapishka_5 TaxID=3037302 RepID=UPI0029E7CEA9|nr:glycoside hydrolase family 2 protein [Lichenihabitans sp. Uapishka_5]MDX7953729.1 glycoside hydrolase family 2 protein [Lichenihabitans sp. Uapishka_5]